MTTTMQNENGPAKKAVFQFITAFHDAIASQDENNIAKVVGKLTLLRQTAAARFYSFGPFALSDGTTIESGRVVSDVNRIEIFGNFKISGVCITREEVWQRYGKLSITGTPKPDVPISETNYTATLSASAIDFGFAEDKPDCLRTIAAGILNPPPYPSAKPD